MLMLNKSSTIILFMEALDQMLVYVKFMNDLVPKKQMLSFEPPILLLFHILLGPSASHEYYATLELA